MRKAFTMIELMVVIGIIGILMGVLLSSFSGSTDSARAAKCQANMHTLAMAVQSFGMVSNHYPRASKWLGDVTDDPYETSSESRKDCFNGVLVGLNLVGSSSFVCPTHEKYAKEHNLGDPLWSYAMNSFFDVTVDADDGASVRGPEYNSLSRADRFLLFAELPYATMDVSGTEIQAEASGDALDPMLDRESEVIGFNHREKKNVFAHVCFADGHVERFRAPSSKSNIKELTQWLCRPHNVTDTGSKSGDFDIRFNGTDYEKDETAE